MMNQRGTSTVLMVIIIILLLVIIGGGAYYLFMSDQSGSKTSSSEQGNTGDEEGEDSDEEEDAEGDDEEGEDTDDEDVVSNQKTANLINVLDGQGSGTAVRKLVNGKYMVTITTKGITDPDGDTELVAWIEKKVPFSQIKLGALEKEEDGVYKLEFESDTDYSLWRFVFVTQEDEDSEVTSPAGAKVLDGNWL